MEKEVQNKELILLPQKLKCSVQNYDWGKIGKESEVARLFSLNSGKSVDVDKPYAEIWMGTHNSGPSFILENSEIGEKSISLSSWISNNPSVLGEKVLKKWGNNLPFLFKVLSVAKALSIQAHPDKKLAEALHKSHPNLYKDDNHKPEMALALTEFEALCGFVSLQELEDVIRTIPEVTQIVGSVEADQVLNLAEQEDSEKVKSILESIFTRLMSANIDEVSQVVSQLTSRLTKDKAVRKLSDKEQLVLQLDKQYPNDIGVISAFFLNYVKLQPGEGLYLGANEPHAYLSGECIECMATSDNVVRAGLTPKLRDVPTLCSMLTYKQGYPEILKGTPINKYTKRYSPPFDEFEVDCCILPQGASTMFPASSGPSLILVTSGNGKMQIESLMEEELKEGNVLFVPAHTEIALASVSDLQVYRAGVNSDYLEKE